MISMGFWSIFRKIRIFTFSICATLNFAMAGVVTFYLFTEWKKYSMFQKGIIAGLAGAEAISGPVMILLIFLKFHAWMDCACVIISLGLQIAGSVLFTVFGPAFPCIGFGSSQMCRQLTQELNIGAWGLSGLFFGYLTFLSIMICFAPSPYEVDLDDQFEPPFHMDDKKERDIEKHQSSITVASFFPREQREKSTTVGFGTSLTPSDAASIMRQQQQYTEEPSSYAPGFPRHSTYSPSQRSDSSSRYNSIYASNSFVVPDPSDQQSQTRMTFASSRAMSQGSVYSLASAQSDSRGSRIVKHSRLPSKSSGRTPLTYNRNDPAEPAYAYGAQRQRTLDAVPEGNHSTRPSYYSAAESSYDDEEEISPPLPTYAGYPGHQRRS